MTSKYNVLGITDELDYCEVCGKRGLKRVVVLQNCETGEEIHAGCDCAGYLLNGKKTASNTRVTTEHAMIVERARGYLVNGHTPEVVVSYIGRQGYPCDIKNGVIRIGTFATINV